MSSLHKSAVSLGFYGDDLDPDEITQMLGGEPTVGTRKGGTWQTSRGADKIAITGSWRRTTDRCEPGDLDGQINRLLGGLSDDLPSWRRLASQFRGRIFCGLFLANGNEGLSLQPETLALLSERGLLLDLDIYGADMPD